MVKIKETATASPPPSSALTLLAELAEDGFIDAGELVRLAPSVAPGNDASFISSIEAILPLKTTSPGVFQQGLRAILVESGLGESVDTQLPMPPQPRSEQDANEASAVQNKVTNEPSIVKEIVVTCIDISGSMQTPFEVDDDVRTVDRTRLNAVKQLFYGFRDQTQLHRDGSGHLLGLVSFNNSVTIHANPTNNFDVFEDSIDDLEPSGSTAIYEAVAIACDKILRPLAIKHPSANLRILVLSDGQNNCHNVTADDALQALGAVGAVCDAMIIGGSQRNADGGLRRLVSASEGKCVEIAGLADAFEALESEAMISLASRRAGGPDFDREGFRSRLAALSSVNDVDVAPMKRGAVVATHQKSTVAGPCVPMTTALKAPQVKPSDRRLLKELSAIGTAQLENFKIFPILNEDGSLSKAFNIIFLGKQGHAAYGGRAFKLGVQLPSDYPFKPPRLRFETPFYHYAVSTDGAICMDIIQTSWSPSLSLKSVLLQLDTLLHDPQKVDPDCNHAIRSWLSDLLRTDPERYFRDASAHSKAHGKEVQPGMDEPSLLRLFD